MPTYRLTVAYDGTAFHGWQKQEPPVAGPGGSPAGSAVALADATLPARPGRVALRTVQAVLERAVAEVVREPITLTGASRTDAGVHAVGQVAAFACSDGRSPDRPGGGWPIARGTLGLVRAINGRLPPDVLVRSASPVDEGFDPIGQALCKCYSYTFHDHPQRPLFDRHLVTHTHHRLDERAMAQAARWLVGEHDFAAFAQAHHGRQSTVRTLTAARVDRVAPARVVVTVVGTGFLYNMVRIIAGTLHEVGRGRLDPNAVPAILASRDRRRAGPTAGPGGLCLRWIRYPGDPSMPIEPVETIEPALHEALEAPPEQGPAEHAGRPTEPGCGGPQEGARGHG
ncbi:MAG: tRNA pseudouridine(38-40) synthase TruA [Phycisphaerales bacterium]|nr:MAG: tRNA pseudouridine(38-40) synthase TruA [Phycisphaerales bacterium]